MTEKTKKNVLIASYLEPELVEKIKKVDPQRLNIIHEPSLIFPPRYICDHKGIPGKRSPEDEARWKDLLSNAEIMYDFDWTHRQELPDLAPNVRWIQSSSTGMGEFVHQMGYDTRMPNTVITLAGIHGRPLAEFAIMSLLMHYKNYHLMDEWKKQKRWDRTCATDAEGRVMAIVGLGRNGAAVARLARGINMKVIGTDLLPKGDVVDKFYEVSQLHAMLKEAEVLVLAVPPTPLTDEMIKAKELSLLKKGAYFINVCRGSVVNEQDLINALNSGQLSGAALDVFNDEPLPPTSPFWEMENVIISPHSASTSDRENERLVELFCDNLRRYLAGDPLRHVLDMKLLY